MSYIQLDIISRTDLSIRIENHKRKQTKGTSSRRRREKNDDVNWENFNVSSRFLSLRWLSIRVQIKYYKYGMKNEVWWIRVMYFTYWDEFFFFLLSWTKFQLDSFTSILIYRKLNAIKKCFHFSKVIIHELFISQCCLAFKCYFFV